MDCLLKRYQVQAHKLALFSHHINPDRHDELVVQVNKLEITADKQLLAAAGNPSVKIYEVNSGNATPIHSFEGHTGNVTGARPLRLSCRCSVTGVYVSQAFQG